MAKYASGSQAWGYSDRSGFRYRLAEMRKEWNGLKVGPDEYEPKHPQLEPIKVGPDPQALRDPRPDQRTETAVEQLLLIYNPFVSGSSGSAVITVLEPSHGRTTGDIVRFRKVGAFDGFSEAVLEASDGYTITVVDSGSYTFTASSGTATTGNQRGGGANATAGPVTLEN
jgi:hypothetical protein